MRQSFGIMMVVSLWLTAPLCRAAIVKGPYLQDVRQDSIVVAAETDVNQSCFVEWGQAFEYSQPLEADGVHQEGRITGLLPSSCYPYLLRCGSDTSPQSSFCSAAAAGEAFSFVLFGDTRSNHETHRQLADLIRAEQADFVINSGDLVADGENEEDWVPFFEAEGDLLRETPLFPVVGNHDCDDLTLDRYQRLFAPPTESSGSERYYAFTYGNARFLVLDNQSTVLMLQKAWFEEELDAAAGDPQIEHLFVVLHENMYSSKDGRSGDWYFRSWRTLMKDKGVDVVFAGHDHYYERGLSDNGLIYIISGGGGAGLYDTENATEGTPVDVFYPAHQVHYSRKVNHYLRIDITGPHLEACAKDLQGQSFDCFAYGELPDGGLADAGEPDGAGEDGGLEDAGEQDAGGEDAGGEDAGGEDAGGEDAGLLEDGGQEDGNLEDAGSGGDAAGDGGQGCDCSGLAEEPVCGEDGQTYANVCELDCAQVGMRHQGPCEEEPDPCDCPDIDEPVCGQDGITYRNPCAMECMGIAGDHEGPCEEASCGCGPRGGGSWNLGCLLLLLVFRRRSLTGRGMAA